MTGNPLPWIVIAAVVVMTLYAKGHLRLPALKAKPSRENANFTSAPDIFGPKVDIDALAKLGSYVLGVALAKSVRAEAETSLAHQMGQDATRAMSERVTAPFSEPAPAGQSNSQAPAPPVPR